MHAHALTYYNLHAVFNQEIMELKGRGRSKRQDCGIEVR
jgi:hypothetical protein